MRRTQEGPEMTFNTAGGDRPGGWGGSISRMVNTIAQSASRLADEYQTPTELEEFIIGAGSDINELQTAQLREAIHLTEDGFTSISFGDGKDYLYCKVASISEDVSGEEKNVATKGDIQMIIDFLDDSNIPPTCRALWFQKILGVHLGVSYGIDFIGEDLISDIGKKLGRFSAAKSITFKEDGNIVFSKLETMNSYVILKLEIE